MIFDLNPDHACPYNAEEIYRHLDLKSYFLQKIYLSEFVKLFLSKTRNHSLISGLALPMVDPQVWF